MTLTTIDGEVVNAICHLCGSPLTNGGHEIDDAYGCLYCGGEGLGNPLIVDLFCGAGGASEGLVAAGFTVVGIDIKPQPNYPWQFYQSDALDVDLMWFAAVWASPPCQAFTQLNNRHKDLSKRYPDLIAPVRELLQELKMPYIMENVPGAPLREPITLCGQMFDLGVYRHRLFETSFPLQGHVHVKHQGRAAYGRIPKAGEKYTVTGHFGDLPGAKKAMGMDDPWRENITRRELAESIPPVYSEFLASQLIKQIEHDVWNSPERMDLL